MKEGEQYIERFSALVTVGVAPILVAMITVRVEIGGYTIQFYQNNHSGIIWDFVYNPMGGVQLIFCTPNGLPIHFQWRVANIYNFPNLELSAYKNLLIKIKHAHDENALFNFIEWDDAD